MTLALDLGSTRLKAARVEPEAGIVDFAAHDAPPASGAGAVREFDGLALERAARAALDALAPRRGERLAIASQRSTFLLWEARTGTPATPAISWQDRRAARWIGGIGGIGGRPELAALAGDVAGLPLSAHYVGPKLATLFAEDEDLARRARAGGLRFGTLDTWLAWRWSGGRLHAVDETMAARTLLFDPSLGVWSPELCASFGVPVELLPRVLPTAERAPDELVELDSGAVLAVSVADQSAGALHAVGSAESGVLVNFGTGTFVLAPAGERRPRLAGYLLSLLSSRGAEAGRRARRFALEGTVNAGARLLARNGTPGGFAALPDDAFALVDEHGIGAPHWRADLGPVWSEGAARLDEATRARVAEEGLCFRVRAILEDLGAAERRCVVAGGPLHDAAVAQRIANSLGAPLEVCLEPEATLLGAAALAEGAELEAGRAPTRRATPETGLAAPRERFAAWREWSRRVLAR